MNTKKQRGDVAILIVTMMVLIMSFIVITASQKTFRDVRLGRKGVGSQQAVQAANIGVEFWFMELRSGNIDTGTVGGADLSKRTVDDLDGDVDVSYEVTYDPANRIIVSKGYAQVPGGDEVVRVLEVQL